jgi:hypothetical protein
MLHSDPTPTFSHTTLSTYTPSYKIPDTWDCITVVSDFPDTVPAHPFDILPRVAPKPFTVKPFAPLCAPGPIHLITLLSFALDILMEIP